MADILVVDDNLDVRRVISQALEFAGHEVEAVPDGSRALIGFRRRGADLVIVDVPTSEPDGHKAISEIRSLSDRVKILALSGGDMARDGRLAATSALVADDVLAKPFSLMGLLVAVEGLLPAQRFMSLVKAS